MNSKAGCGRCRPADEPAAEQPHSWLAALRARLGLPGAPTLRATLEDALKGAGDGHAFSAEEREMLLRILRFGGAARRSTSWCRAPTSSPSTRTSRSGSC